MNRDISNPAISNTINNKPGMDIIALLIKNFITLLFIVATITAFFLLITASIRYITSGGDKGQAEAASKQMTAAIIGLILIFSIYAVFSLIGDFFGMNLLLFDLGPLFL